MLTILIGLPGSGKSTLGDGQAAASPGTRVYKDFLGWYRPLTEGQGLFSLLADVQAGRSVVADDVFLCRPTDRAIFSTLLAPFVPAGYPVRWAYFANSPAICRRNVELRDRHHPDPQRKADALMWVDRLTLLYEIPEGAERHPVIDHSG